MFSGMEARSTIFVFSLCCAPASWHLTERCWHPDFVALTQGRTLNRLAWVVWVACQLGSHGTI